MAGTKFDLVFAPQGSPPTLGKDARILNLVGVCKLIFVVAQFRKRLAAI